MSKISCCPTPPRESLWTRILLVTILLVVRAPAVQLQSTNVDSDRAHRSSKSDERVHHRQKRLLWITSDGRLALPPGTTMVIAPSLSLPFVRYPPEGFASNLTISLPFTINFDKLGLTDNENPYGALPPLLARSMGAEVSNVLGQYVMHMMTHKRKRRSVSSRPAPTGDAMPELPKQHAHAFHGGERALLYTVAEDFLEQFGMDGKACLLRAICEVHANRLEQYGIVGEIMKLFLTASQSPFAHYIPEYVEAENAGSGKSGPTECWPYMKDCPKSIFTLNKNKYRSENSNEDDAVTAIYDSNAINM